MTRWVYVRTIMDKFRGPNVHLSVTADGGGAVPGRVIGDDEELNQVFRRAGLERFTAQLENAQAKGEVFCSGPLEITQEQEDILLGRS